MTLTEKYKERLPLAILYTSSSTTMLVMDVNETEDKILVCDVYYGKRYDYRWHLLHYNTIGSYIIRNRCRYYMSEFIKLCKWG